MKKEKKVFSVSEVKVLKLLGRKKMTVQELANLFYKDQKPTVSPGNSIVGFLSSVNRKTAYHKMNWCVDGEGAGRGGKTVWLTTRRKAL